MPCSKSDYNFNFSWQKCRKALVTKMFGSIDRAWIDLKLNTFCWSEKFTPALKFFIMVEIIMRTLLHSLLSCYTRVYIAFLSDSGFLLVHITLSGKSTVQIRSWHLNTFLILSEMYCFLYHGYMHTYKYTHTHT